MYAFSDAPSAGATIPSPLNQFHGTSDVIVELRGVSDPKIVNESYRLRGSPAINSEMDKINAVSRRPKRTERKQDFVFSEYYSFATRKKQYAPQLVLQWRCSILAIEFRLRESRLSQNSVTKRPEFAGTYFEDIVDGLKGLTPLGK